MKEHYHNPDAGHGRPATVHANTLHTLDELAAEAKVCRRLLELEINRGRLRATRLSNRVRIREADWLAYLDAGMTAPAAAPAVN